MSFIKRFQASLESLNIPYQKPKYVVAYSGGVDSHVLLHCCALLNVSVRAVHIHHGLQSSADDWVGHCQQTCNTLNIPLEILHVDASKKKGESPEETARKVRYKALQNNLISDEVLLTGQHLNDQAETLLLQLFRSGSSAGLSAMPSVKSIGKHFHLRPMLFFSRAEIENYAVEHSLNWIEDPSNQDVNFDRNFIRKNIIPSLETRWPEVTLQLSTVASLQASNLVVLNDMAAIDLANATLVQSTKTHIFKVVSVLSIDKLKALSSYRLLNLLRYWLTATLQVSPTKKLLEEIERALIHAQHDACPNLVFSVYSFKKFQDRLYALDENKISNADDIKWNPRQPLPLINMGVTLKAVTPVSNGLNPTLLDETLHIRFRKGGEKFHPAGRGHSQSLKKLLQEANVPPWERDVMPLVYFKDILLAVGSLWLATDYTVGEGEQGWALELESAD